MKKITTKKLDKLYSLYDELNESEILASDKLKKAKDNKGAKLEIKRDGKKVKIKESDLWEEVRYLGEGCDAYKALNKKYPDVFKAFEEQNKKALELKIWVAKNFGLDYRAVKLSDIFKISEAVFEYKSFWNKLKRKLRSLFND